MKTTLEFRIRAKQWILSVVRQRLYLIRTNKAKSPHQDEVRVDAESIRNNLQLLYSDLAVAEFIIRNSSKIYRIIPKRVGCAAPQESRLRELLEESISIKSLCKTPQNLVR